jgi:hypothetical protein
VSKHSPFWDTLVDSNTYRVFSFANESREDEIVELFDGGKPLASLWDPIEVKLYDKEEGESDKPLADFMRILFGPVISARGVAILKPLINNTAEFLPLTTKVGAYFALNVYPVDCLDEEHSVVVRFPNSERIMDVEKYAFSSDRLKEVHAFRLPQLGPTHLFVSNEFRKTVEANNLTGLLFYSVPLA